MKSGSDESETVVSLVPFLNDLDESPEAAPNAHLHMLKEHPSGTHRDVSTF
jgi:hypothetical protein